MSRSLSRLFFVLFAVALATGVLGVILVNGGGRGDGNDGMAFVLVGGASLVAVNAARIIATAAARQELRARILQVLAAAARRGESVGGALEAMGREHDGEAGGVLKRMLSALDGGGSLEGALEAAGKGIFTPEDRATMRAVAGSARSTQALEMLARSGEDAGRVGWKVELSLLYAAAILFPGFFITAMVTPRFFHIAGSFDLGGAGAAIAARGQADLAFVHEVIPWVFWVGVAFLLLFLWQDVRSRSEAGRRRWRERLLLVPGVAGVVRLRAAERVCRTLGFLVSGGTPLHEALTRAAWTAGVPSLERSLDEAAAAVAHGEPLPRALEGTRLPRFSVDRIVAAAAGTAPSLAGSLEALARECGLRARLRADGLASSIYPVVLLLGGAVAFLLFRGVFGVTEGIREAMRPW